MGGARPGRATRRRPRSPLRPQAPDGSRASPRRRRSRLPCASKTIVVIATPAVAPSSWVMFSTPDALPSHSGRTLFSPAAGCTAVSSRSRRRRRRTAARMRRNRRARPPGARSRRTRPPASADPGRPARRAPNRSYSAPAIGEISSGVAVHGRNRNPAASGESPRPNWKYSLVRNAAEKMAAPVANWVRTAIGEPPATEQAERDHRRRRRAPGGRRTSPAEPWRQRTRVSTRALVHPSCWPSTIAHTECPDADGHRGEPEQVQGPPRAEALAQA